MKNIEIINKNTFGDGSPSSSNSQQKKEDIEVQNCELEDQPPSSKIHLEKDISTSRDSTCILLDMFSMPTQKISHGDSSESKQENEVITIEDDVTQIESKKPNLQDGSAIHSGTGDSKCEQDTSLDEIEKLYTCPTQKINHICEDVGAMDILVEKYSSKEGLLYLFEECLEECIKNVKSADTTIENHLRTLQFYLSKLKSLHKNDNKLMEEKSSDKELCDAEAQVTVDITDETVQTEYNGTDIGIQTEDLHCIKCNIDLNRNRVVGAATLISQDKKNPAECEKKLSSHDTGLNKTNTPLLNQHMQCDEFTCTLDNLNFETQDLTTNQGIITKIFSKSRSQKSKTSQNEAHTSVTKAKENIVGDILMCSVDSNKSVGSNRINQKSTCDADKSIRFKRIKPPTSDSDSEDDVPAKRKCNRFLRDDLTIEFLNNPEGTDFKNKTSLVESQNSEGINYDVSLFI